MALSDKFYTIFIRSDSRKTILACPEKTIARGIASVYVAVLPGTLVLLMPLLLLYYGMFARAGSKPVMVITFALNTTVYVQSRRHCQIRGDNLQAVSPLGGQMR